MSDSDSYWRYSMSFKAKKTAPFLFWLISAAWKCKLDFSHSTCGATETHGFYVVTKTTTDLLKIVVK